MNAAANATVAIAAPIAAVCGATAVRVVVLVIAVAGRELVARVSSFVRAVVARVLVVFADRCGLAPRVFVRGGSPITMALLDWATVRDGRVRGVGSACSVESP